MGGPAKMCVEELQEAGETEEAAKERKRGKSDHRIPLVGFRDAVGDLQPDRNVTATNSPPTDEIDFPLGGAIEIHPD